MGRLSNQVKRRLKMSKQTIGSVEVHTFALPQKGFNPLTASAQELMRHGFPEKPDSVKMPEAAAKWVMAFRRYPDFEHIAPEFKPLHNHHHRPNHRTAKNTQGHVNATS